MLLPRVTALLPLLAAVQAFKNTAPFLMLSTVDLSGVMPATELAKHEKIEDAMARAYTEKTCKDGRHVLIAQPGLTRADLPALPKFMGLATSSKLSGRLEVPHVIGTIDAGLVQNHMVAGCGPATAVESNSWSWSKSNTKEAKLSVYNGEALPEEQSSRTRALQKLDTTLEELLRHYPTVGPYTIVIVSSPQTTWSEIPAQYEMDEPYPSAPHQDLKRNLGVQRRASNSSSNRTSDNFQDGLPLFERYQYTNPALFMGLSVSLLLLIILYVGISAISGLEVSYMAFSKEMAPQNQKKQ